MPPPDPETLERLRSNSQIRLDREGRFWHEGALVEHPRIVELFHRGLGRAPDGRATLTAGNTWCYITLEDTLYLARRAFCEPGPAPDVLWSCRLLLNDGTEEPLHLGPAQVAVSPEGVLYARVKSGQEWARLIPEAHVALGQYVIESSAGGLSLHTVRGDFPLLSHEPREISAIRRE